MNVPNHTVYVNRLNEKLKVEDLKKGLQDVFSQFGPIIEIKAKKSLKCKGQAWVVFEKVDSAAKAVQDLPGFLFYNKPMQVAFAKTTSDVIAKKNGTFVPREKPAATEPPAQAVASNGFHSGIPPPSGQPVAAQGAPNRILFAQNLPADLNTNMVQMLFNQFEGFQEFKLVDGKPGIAFIHFQTAQQSSKAMQHLQGFKITDTCVMQLSYAQL